MPRTPRWRIQGAKNGLAIVTLSSWRWFSDWINQELLDYRDYIFRGHASDRWKLESTLDRLLKTVAPGERTDTARRHLDNFRMAVRGRRGLNPAPLASDDDWWALGQHHGLATPLLDWTEIPFAALYFGFNGHNTDGAEHRCVWAINQYAIPEHNELKKAKLKAKFGPDDELRLIRPLSDDNARLVSQRGLFVRGPYGIALEAAVEDAFAGYTSAPLLKIRIPNKERALCLRSSTG